MRLLLCQECSTNFFFSLYNFCHRLTLLGFNINSSSTSNKKNKRQKMKKKKKKLNQVNETAVDVYLILFSSRFSISNDIFLLQMIWKVFRFFVFSLLNGGRKSFIKRNLLSHWGGNMMEIVINSEAIPINPLLSGPVGIIWGSSHQLSLKNQ